MAAHGQLLEACSGRREAVKWSREWLALRYRFLESRLRDADLQAPDAKDTGSITSQDLLGELAGEKLPHYFLNFFSRRGLENLFDKLGLSDAFRKRGFEPYVALRLDDPGRHLLQIHDGAPEPSRLLVEVAGRQDVFLLDDLEGLPPDRYRMLVLDWVLLQNPAAGFTARRRPLPGQEHPGLGIGNEIGEMLALMAMRLQCDGILAAPNHYHNACLYSRKMWFLKACRQGEFLALERDLGHLGLAERSWAVELGCVETNGAVFKWPGARMVLPLEERLHRYVQSPPYEKTCAESREALRFNLNQDCWEKAALPEPEAPRTRIAGKNSPRRT
jgi:hypothetical protein